ncbi:IPT/TIG domain-containing protein [Tenacibaculum finnmarkense]|uniref:IPT/TIG domain-containing protein n=1 Tax=Tenacibaculum finnmarkense TaxID=2781243 RepID=UPI0021D448C8|nr:IPT/TIG domain-containing protein [Tenacibaculum finnmarkense]MCD8446322.1 IPT/TIG domain-containing protein [Tenacibaculum finnmarkense genomovar finnmarkense]
MNKHKYLLIILVLLSIIISCSSNDEESEPQTLEPEVLTFNATIGTNGGVDLIGSYNSNGNSISEIGFEYSIDSLFNNKIVLNSELNSNSEIEYFLANGIKENVKYFYKAFAKSSGESFFGNTKSFISDGSVAPEVNSISNNLGHIADTLEIYGKYFKDNNYETFVDFSNVNGQIISLNDSIIKCKVPTNINNVINDVRVRIDNRGDSYSSFTLFEPTIETINPIVGVIGDTLSINGNHFDIVNSRNIVFFGNIQSSIIESNRESIKIIVPENIESPTELIKLNAQLQDVAYNTSFQLSAPKINSISPLNATFSDEITITGNNFDFEISRNKVYFGNIEATITYADKNTLIVTVPDDLESSSEPIKVIAQLQEVVFNEKFQLIPPEINFVPQDVYANQDITIQGAYFHPILDRNNITIENIEVNLISGNTKSLDTKIPLGPFPRRKAIVSIELLDLIVTYEIELNILDKWIMVSNNLPFRFYRGINNAVVANNEAFVIAPSADEFSETSTLYLWKFNPEDFRWEQSNIPFTMKWSAVSVSNGNKIFIYDAEGDNGFWQFDPITEQWNQLTAYPGARRDYPTHFSINDDIYIGMGADFEPYTSIKYGDFYKYSPTTNSWTQIADFTYKNYFLRTETSTFTINDIAYVGNGATNTGMIDYWSYHPNTDEWIRIADFNDSRRYTASFELNGFGYVTGGTPTGWGNVKDCWRYDPSLDSWTQIDDIGHIKRGGHFSFSLNDKAYIGGGGIYDSGGSTGYDFYEFIP